MTPDMDGFEIPELRLPPEWPGDRLQVRIWSFHHEASDGIAMFCSATAGDRLIGAWSAWRSAEDA